jgi:hypothetical protein
MTRDEEIDKITRRMSKDVNRLNDLQCSLDSVAGSMVIFDHTRNGKHDTDSPQIVWSFMQRVSGTQEER